MDVDLKNFPAEIPGHRVAGKWIAADGNGKLAYNPSNGQLIASFQLTEAQINQTIEACESSRQKIASTTMDQRYDILVRLRKALADYNDPIIKGMTIEAGKPRWVAQGEFAAALAFLDRVVEERDGFEQALLAPVGRGFLSHKTKLRAIGTTLSFLPFSTAIGTFVQSFAGSVLAGCPLIVAIPAQGCLTGILMARLEEELDMPASMLNVLFGGFRTFKRCFSDSRIKAILYTGSREHCEAIRKESPFHFSRQLLLQSGGKNSIIIHSSSDIDTALPLLMHSAYRFAGQLCTSASQAFVHHSKIEQVCQALAESVSSMEGRPTDGEENPFLGPLYSKKAVDKFLRFQTMAQRESSKTLVRGKGLSRESEGFFVRPGLHFFDHFDPSKAYQRNVLLSPDFAIYRYDKLSDAIAWSNATDAPYVTGFIGDPSIIEKRRDAVLAPNLAINVPTTELEVSLPIPGLYFCGSHKFAGASIAFSLSYPVANLNRESLGELMNQWRPV